jgi:hypothetical protein
MEKTIDGGIGSFVSRRISHLKILSRLLEHELDATKSAKDVTLDRDIVESMLETVENFVEDFEDNHKDGGPKRDRARSGDTKPAVTRLN